VKRIHLGEGLRLAAQNGPLEGQGGLSEPAPAVLVSVRIEQAAPGALGEVPGAPGEVRIA
jgi:hypothetical protein